MEDTKQKEWFKAWFNTPYYHLLYKHRDHKEAASFIDNLIKELNPSAASSILDLACGRGRHSIYLNEKGFEVTGVDISESSILFAKAYENDRLKFEIHDMRCPFERKSFDVILNLFTSFGYFDDREDNQRVIDSAYESLKPGGTLVLDYLNTEKVSKTLPIRETIAREDVVFTILKRQTEEDIVKEISFSAEKKEYKFSERVNKISTHQFEEYFQKSGFTIKAMFGDYKLQGFDPETSDRMIWVVER